MNPPGTRGARHGLMLLAGVMMFAVTAAAQQPSRLPRGAIVQPMGSDPGAELRRHLTTLADNPRSVDALIGAGRAALRSGDAEAALSFFGRADEISPRNARIKAGLASALAQLGRPQPALGLFQQALSLGAPLGEIAGDRGLAFDMVGDTRRAQQDYTAALRYRDDDEVRRRMALSLAISGEREAALRIIDPQLRRNDRAAWRTQAFILALTGDASGATRSAQGMMPPGAAQAISPFLARLSLLSPQQKAMAVHLGHFPSNARAAAATQGSSGADAGALALAMGGAPATPRATAAAEEPTRTANRRRPGRTRDSSGGESGGRRRVAESGQDSADPFGLRGRRGTRRQVREAMPTAPSREQERREVAQVNTRWAGAPGVASAPAEPPRPTPAPIEQPRLGPPAAPAAQTDPAAADRQAAQAEVPQSQRGERPIQTTNLPAATASAVANPTTPSTAAGATVTSVGAPPLQAPSEPEPVTTERRDALSSAATPGFTSMAPDLPTTSEPAAAAPAGQDQEQTVSTAAPTAPAPAAAGPLADIASIVQTLPEEDAPAAATPPPAPPERRPARRTAEARTEPAARPRTAQPAHPRRHWVQIAGGANRAAFPGELARLRRLAPELAGRTGWTTPLNATNRLLVGPFPSEREAQEFVNQLAQREVAAFAWTSPAGQEIHRLTGR